MKRSSRISSKIENNKWVTTKGKKAIDYKFLEKKTVETIAMAILNQIIDKVVDNSERRIFSLFKSTCNDNQLFTFDQNADMNGALTDKLGENFDNIIVSRVLSFLRKT